MVKVDKWATLVQSVIATEIKNDHLDQLTTEVDDRVRIAQNVWDMLHTMIPPAVFFD